MALSNYKMYVIWTTLLLTIWNIKYCLCGQHDFQFRDDGVQLLYTETLELNEQPNINSHKNSNVCPNSQDKIVLSLILRDKSWDSIVQKKRDRAINKLAKFFMLTKEDFNVDDITKTELYEMSKNAIQRGKNQLASTNKKLGRIEFLLGCGKQLFHSRKLISNQIGHQMKDGSISDISGLDFGWWVIWTKHVNNRTSRTRRALNEGSGEEDDDEDYDDYSEYSEITEVPTSTPHPRRHHHGQNPNKDKKLNTKVTTMTPIAPSTIITDTQIILGSPPVSETSMGTEQDSVVKEFSQLEESILKTIENTKESMNIPEEEVESLPDKSEFDEIIDQELQPIVKTIFENRDEKENERDYIVEDYSSGLFTEENLPSSPSVWKVDASTSTSTDQSTTYNTVTTTSDSTTKTNDFEITSHKNNFIETEEDIQTTSDEITSNEDTHKGQYERIITVPVLVTPKHELERIEEESYDELATHLPQSSTSSTPVQKSTIVTSSDEDELVVIQTTTTRTATSDPNNSQIISSSSNPIIASEPSMSVTNIYNNYNEFDSDNNYITTTTIKVSAPPTTSATTTTTTSTPSTNQQILESSTFNTNPSISLQESDNNNFISTQYNTISSTPLTHISSINTVTSVEDVQNVSSTTPIASPTELEESNYDEEYDDEEEELASHVPSKSSSTVSSTIQTTTPSTTTTTIRTTTTAIPEVEEERNTAPMLRNRLPKTPVTAGKAFSIYVPEENFYDAEDGINLTLELVDRNNHPLKSHSWIQFNPKTREIYGLPLEDSVSRWKYYLRAIDSGNESVTEDLDISVQQHRGHRSVNHEIELQIKLNEKFERNIDWQLSIVNAIVKVLGDQSNSDVVVREIRRPYSGDLNSYIFVYTNDTLPKDHCPEDEAEELVEKLHVDDLNKVLSPVITVKSVKEQLVGNCKKSLPKIKPTLAPSKNLPPMPRNPVDRVNASVGQLLVFKVPSDTFYDVEDGTDYKLSLLSMDRAKLDPSFWLQFDARNREFYGIPKMGDLGQKEYLLLAEDSEGLTATDALVVVVNPSKKGTYGILFDFNLGIPYENFNRSSVQRKFIERIAQVFGDHETNHILIRQIRRLHQTNNVAISWYNTTLHSPDQRCPTEKIEELRSILMHPDSSLRDRVKEILGQEFSLQNINLHPIGACQGADTVTHEIPVKADEPPPHKPDVYLFTFALPILIILLMLLLATIIAWKLHRRRLTGKMELGDEEERKSFRSKGIPVIFQDELDEKPEMGTKSPIILKDEKPPLLPPSYNQNNPDGDNEDLDEYVPPPGVNPVGARESRGKSPVTPSYRKPPPYVSP